MYEKINSPIIIGGLTLKNRIVFAPTTMGLSEDDYVNKMEAIAGGGAAMLTIGDVPVLKHTMFGKSLFSKKGFAFYTRLTKAVHAKGAVICAQLHVSDSDIKGMIKYIPGVLTKKISMEQLRILLNEQISTYITSIPERRVKAITSAFGDAAVLAAKAGFDMLQIHGDRMCGSFCSEVFNKRTDSYGGTVIKRAEFAVEAVTAVRKALPDMPIEYKMAVRQKAPHYGNAGVLEEELGVVIPLLIKAGVNSFHVALANHSQLSDTIPPGSHPYFAEEGCFLKYCDEVRKHTMLPVCGVGGLIHPQFLERQLQECRIDYAAMSRQLIADPQWVSKAVTGRENQIRYCIRCNKECLGGMHKHTGVHCIFDKVRQEDAE